MLPSLPSIPSLQPRIYYDQRIRLEGFDIEWMMDAAGMNVPVLANAPQSKMATAPVKEMQG